MSNKPLTIAAVFAVFALTLAGATAPANACGYERWAVKTLADPQAAALPTRAIATTIAHLVQLRAPLDPDLIPDRLAPTELTLYRVVRARLIGYKIEQDDDLHLALADPYSGQVMIAEIPSPACAPTAAIASRFAGAWASVARIGGRQARRGWWWLDYRGATAPLVAIEGYGFFDRLHEAEGQASNGIELHPVTLIEASAPP